MRRAGARPYRFGSHHPRIFAGVNLTGCPLFSDSEQQQFDQCFCSGKLKRREWWHGRRGWKCSHIWASSARPPPPATIQYPILMPPFQRPFQRHKAHIPLLQNLHQPTIEPGNKVCIFNSGQKLLRPNYRQQRRKPYVVEQHIHHIDRRNDRNYRQHRRKTYLQLGEHIQLQLQYYRKRRN